MAIHTNVDIEVVDKPCQDIVIDRTRGSCMFHVQHSCQEQPQRSPTSGWTVLSLRQQLSIARLCCMVKETRDKNISIGYVQAARRYVCYGICQQLSRPFHVFQLTLSSGQLKTACIDLSSAKKNDVSVRQKCPCYRMQSSE